MKQTTHQNYEKDFQYDHEGIWYNDYFFRVDSENPEKTQVKTLYGGETYLNRCTGYCCLKHFYLTEQQMKKHECRRKQCERFIKTPYSESYWKAEEDKKHLKN